jgi:putative radical SAM enzyme (TIGR03279 family)
MNKKYFKARIIEVRPGSIAEKVGIEKGDSLMAIDDAPLRDLLDYQYAVSYARKITLLIEKSDGCQKEIVIDKLPAEDPGLGFESAVFDRVKSCNNKCIFCFIDQQPPGLRDSLYIKDDDFRLSYLQGTYVTLTNLSEQDKNRIEQLRLGPLFVSVHTTDSKLRIKMLGNPKAGDILQKLNWLNDLLIPVHTQIVVCPGYNDGEVLKNTLQELSQIENILSVAIVPAGITKYRQDEKIKQFTKELALQTLEIVKKVNISKGWNFAFPSDEIFLLAEKEIPESDFYCDYPQLEDGVGSARLLWQNFDELTLPEKVLKPLNAAIVTSSSGKQILTNPVARLNKINNLSIEIIEVKNTFMGECVTVCGLLSGKDVLASLKGIKVLPDIIFLPSVMLRKYTEEFLDGMKLCQIAEKTGAKIRVVQNYYSFREIVDYIVKNNHG